ncbi:hypothetical protein OROMI_004026 [Orobanche minor]
MSNGGGWVLIPTKAEKVEISGNHNNEEVYFMDSSETAQNLLQQEKHESSSSDGPTETKIGSLEHTIDDTVMMEGNQEPEEIQKAGEFAQQVRKVNSLAEQSDFDIKSIFFNDYPETIGTKPNYDYPMPTELQPIVLRPRSELYWLWDTNSDSESEEESEPKERSPRFPVMEGNQEPEEIQKAGEFAQEVRKVNSLAEQSDFDIESNDYPEKSGTKPNYDYPMPTELQPVVLRPHSELNWLWDTNSDFESEEKSESQNKKSPKDMMQFQPGAVFEDDKTRAEPKERSPCLDFPSSSSLVKHGVKRSTEGDAGDKDSKRANKMALQTTDEENKGGGSLMFI